MWEQVTQWLNDISNNPIVIRLTTVLTVFVCVLVVFSKTSVGRKVLKGLNEKFVENGLRISLMEKNYEIFKADVKEETEHIKSNNENFIETVRNDVLIVHSEYEFIEQGFIEILKQVPNEKVQKAIVNYLDEKEKVKSRIHELVGAPYFEIENQIEKEVEVRVEEIEKQSNDEISALRGEIDELKQIINNLLNSAQNDQESEENTDGKEEENTDTEEKVA